MHGSEKSMQLYKCGKLIMKMVSPLKVGLILFTIFGALLASNSSSSSSKPQFHKFPGPPRALDSYTRRSSFEDSSISLSSRQGSFKNFKATTTKPIFAPKLFLILSAHEYDSQSSVESREHLDSPMYRQERPFRTENKNVRSRKNDKKRLRPRKRNPNRRTTPKSFLSTENFRNHPLNNKKVISRQREGALHLETATNPYILLKSTKRKPNLGKRYSNPLIEYKSANSFSSFKNLNLTHVDRFPFIKNLTSQTVINNPYKSIKRKGKSFDIGTINSREDSISLKEYGTAVQNITDQTRNINNQEKLTDQNKNIDNQENLTEQIKNIDIQEKLTGQYKNIENQEKLTSQYKNVDNQDKQTRQNRKIDNQDKLFNYTYQMSAMERGSSHVQDPLSSSEVSRTTTPFPNFYNISQFYNEYRFNKFSFNPRNITIYELLKPKLKTTELAKNLQKLGLARGDGNSKIYAETENKVSNETNIKTLNTELDNETKNQLKHPIINPNASITYELDKMTAIPIINEKQNATSTNLNKIPSILSRKIPNSMINSNLHLHQFNETFTNDWWLNSFNPQNSNGVIQDTERSSDKPKQEPLNLNSSAVLDTETKHVIITTPATTKPVTYSNTESVTDLENADTIREAKMTNSNNTDNTAHPKMDPKTFYEYFMKSNRTKSSTNHTGSPDYKHGGIFRYSDIFRRQPVLGGYGVTRRAPFFAIRTETVMPVTGVPDTTPTRFESLRTTTARVRVLSTFYPNRMRDFTMRFATVPDPTATVPNLFNKDTGQSSEEGSDEAEFQNAIEPGFTMEKLAFLLIGTCCGLSILCLCVVVIAIKCRRVFQEKKFKEHFRRRMYQHEALKDASSPWQQQIYDHFAYLNRHPESSRSSANSCNCHCVTWTLGPRNLEGSKPLFGHHNRNSTFLGGQKKLPFGAASTLRYESMMGRKRASPGMTQMRHEPPVSDSTPENDSLEQPDSDSRDSEGPRHCTCVDYTMWPISTDVLRGMNRIYPSSRHYIAGDCSQHGAIDERPLPRDYPPPVTGSNYLDRSEGVVYWTSNNERLI
ncbi:uncharacterized protein [Parasteatoda tepidariorum]|uniref:uncharacterized protein n=1 Tax=Parasteatoda tepidariorum TaxID=114398 RepID=UPI001C71A278|nr:uncharacterized protein LOC107445848 [Parasteatoda tepidariorum]